MMEFYRAEYKYVDVRTKLWAHQKQIETGIDKENGDGATVFTIQFITSHFMHPYSK